MSDYESIHSIAINDEPIPVSGDTLRRIFADRFRDLAGRWRRSHPFAHGITGAQALELHAVADDTGRAILDAHGKGLLSNLDGLAELAAWHTTPDANDPKVGGADGRQSRLVRCASNLQMHVFSRIIPRIEPAILGMQRPEREARACDILAAMIESESQADKPRVDGTSAKELGAIGVWTTDQPVTPAMIAKVTGKTPGAVRKKLFRYRREHPDCYVPAEERRKNHPRDRYLWGKIKHLFTSVGASNGASNGASSEKNI